MRLRLGILTSTDTRHRYFANVLRRRFDAVAIGYERTGYSPIEVEGGELAPHEERLVAAHFAERARQEEVFFGSDAELAGGGPEYSTRTIERGRLNTAETLQLLEARGVDTVVVYGTNLIKAPLIDRWPGRMINMHLGLSPYYRGTATNFYPLLNEEPEYVGATIHLIDAGIDSGPILRHARPVITAEDMPHTIGCKAILAGIEALVAVLDQLETTGMLRAVPQWSVRGARLYLRKDYHPRQVVELYRKIEAGLIPDYVARAAWAACTLRLVD